MTGEQDKAVVVTNSALPAALGTTLRMAMIVLTALPGLEVLLGKRDLVGLIRFFLTDPGATFYGACAFFATAAWGLVATIRKHAKTRIAALNADDRVARVISLRHYLLSWVGR